MDQGRLSAAARCLLPAQRIVGANRFDADDDISTFSYRPYIVLPAGMLGFGYVASLHSVYVISPWGEAG